MYPTRMRTPAGAATALALGMVVFAAAWTHAQDAAPAVAEYDPATATAEKMDLATRSIILDIANANDRAVAVGERGHILVSESRRDWRQVEGVPTRSTLTGVSAVGNQVWAVGHDGIILHSADGGLTWARQRLAPYDPQSTDETNGAPLLDVMFLDENTGYAIGAYSLLLKTTDGGQTWNTESLANAASAPGGDAAAGGASDASADGGADTGEGGNDWTFDQSELELEEESNPHLNAITRTSDGSLFIVAERGSAFRSTDSGQSWQRLQLPYDGSMFGVIGYEGRHVLAFGLRGNVFESTDLGDTWKKIDTGVDLSIMGGVGWNNGGAALVGANGLVLTRSAQSAGLLKHTHPDGTILAAALVLGDAGELVVAGETGIGVYTPN